MTLLNPMSGGKKSEYSLGFQISSVSENDDLEYFCYLFYRNNLTTIPRHLFFFDTMNFAEAKCFFEVNNQ